MRFRHGISPLLFNAGTHCYDAPIGTRYRTLDEQEVVIRIHFDDSQIQNGVLLGSHMARHAASGINAGRIGRSADTARCTVEHASVGITAAPKPVATNHTLETLALRNTGHVDPGHILKVFNRQSLAHLEGGSIRDPDFL